MNRFYVLLIGFIFACCNRPNHETEKAPYAFAHSLDSTVVFNEGKIPTMNGINFSHDGKSLYISRSVDNKFDNGKSLAGIFVSYYEFGRWSVPEQIKFDIDCYHPVLSVDNELLMFNSRSHPDSANKAVPHNIWMAHKTKNGWGQPDMVKGVNAEGYDSYPSLAANNNLYFNSDRPGGLGGMDVYVSYYVDGTYQTPINILAINSTDEENDLVVDPKERFIIFNRYKHATEDLDLYISYNHENNWTAPEELKSINTRSGWELTPTLSPDGKYFFYELDGNIMQIELSAIVPAGKLASDTMQ